MMHIRERSSSSLPGFSYTVVNTSKWVGPIEDHPSLLEIPDVVELVYGEIPTHAQYTYYPAVEDSCLGI